MRREGIATLREVADVLARHGDVCCLPTIEEEDGAISMTLRLVADTVGASLANLEFFEDSRRLQDRVTLRALAQRYDIDAAQLEALLPFEKE